MAKKQFFWLSDPITFEKNANFLKKIFGYWNIDSEESFEWFVHETVPLWLQTDHFKIEYMIFSVFTLFFLENHVSNFKMMIPKSSWHGFMHKTTQTISQNPLYPKILLPI